MTTSLEHTLIEDGGRRWPFKAAKSEIKFIDLKRTDCWKCVPYLKNHEIALRYRSGSWWNRRRTSVTLPDFRVFAETENERISGLYLTKQLQAQAIFEANIFSVGSLVLVFLTLVIGIVKPGPLSFFTLTIIFSVAGLLYLISRVMRTAKLFAQLAGYIEVWSAGAVNKYPPVRVSEDSNCAGVGGS